MSGLGFSWSIFLAHGLKTAQGWDIAVLASGTLENTERWELAQALAVQLKQDVDLVDLRLSADICERMKKWWD